MQDFVVSSFSTRLRELTAELRLLDRDLKSNPSPDAATLREFRQALDNVRMTAWIVNEVLDARERQNNPQTLISFLTAERLRRFGQMARDLSADLEDASASWPAQAVKDLNHSLAFLRDRLREVGKIE